MSIDIYDGFVYMWTDHSNGKKYIGSHKGTVDDGYIGSGVHFVRAYKSRPDSFSREILEYVQGDVLTILEAEQKYLDQIDNYHNFYNISRRATSCPIQFFSKTKKEEFKATMRGVWKNKTIEERETLKKNLIQNQPKEIQDIAQRKKSKTWGEKNSSEFEKMKKGQRKRRKNETKETKQITGGKISESILNLPEDIKSERYSRVSKSNKKYWESLTNEERQNRSKTIKNAMKDLKMKWMYDHKTLKKKLVPEKDQNQLLENGWLFGKPKKPKQKQ